MPDLTALGIHVYAGGFTCGIQDSFKIVGQMEEPFGKATFGTETFHINFPEVPQINSEVGQPVVDAWNPSAFSGVNLVYGNPPCSAFSVVGSRKYMDDPVLNYTRNTFNAALLADPDIFVWECVPNIWGKGRPVIDEAAALFEGHGYQINVFFTNWLMHGAPTSRERFHFIATRYRLPFERHFPDFHSAEDVVTVRETIEHLEQHPYDEAWNHTWCNPDDKDRVVIERLHQGEGWGAGYERARAEGLTARKGRIVAGRMIYDAPSRTLLDLGCSIHPTLNRHITVREGARLCGFPDWFVFKPSRDPFRRMTEVTKAVIPPAGRFLGKLFKDAIAESTRVVPTGIITVTDWRSIGRPYTPGRYFKKWVPEAVRNEQIALNGRPALGSPLVKAY